MELPSVITIDGPAASGKSTLGELLARRLGYVYFDTGVLYRALTLLALRRDVSVDDEHALTALARRARLEVAPPTVNDGRQYTVFADGEDVTWALRDVAVERHVSRIAGYPEVRAALRAQQRSIGLRGNVVMVGRDIGTVVMPDADYKIFLEASPEARAQRRQIDLARRGIELSLESVAEDLRRRDMLDRRNTLLPEDAVILHTDGLTPEEEVSKILGAFNHERAIERAASSPAPPSPAAK